MMRRISKLAIASIPAVLTLGFSLHAQTQPTLSGFALGALPNPVGYELDTTITGVVFGAAGTPAPDGQIDFFISADPTDCLNEYTDIGSGTISGGVASVTFYAVPPSGLGNTLPVCGNYTATSSGYAPATAGPFVLTIYQPTSLIVYVPPASLPGTPVNFNVALSYSTSQPAPTGTITIEDPNNGYTTVGGPVTVGTITVNGNSVQGATISNVTLSSNQYLAVYSGDNNYAQEYAQGTIFLENPLTSISPASFMAGAAVAAPNTSCQTAAGAPGLQVTLTGIGFTGNTTAQIQVGAGNYAQFPVAQSGSSPTTQLIGCIPTGELANPTTLTFETSTGGITGGPVTFQVYAPYQVTTTVTSTPASFAYGANLTSIIDGTATRTAATDAAVPAGTATFSLTRITGANGIPITLGTGQFSQVSTPGAYQSPFVAPIDVNQTQKTIASDLNGDGYVDVVGLPGYYYGDTAAAPYLQVFLSTGANAFQAEQEVFAGCAPQDFAVGDINGDNIPDLVVVCTGVVDSYLQAYYMLGNGDGTFGPPTPFGTGSQVGAPTQVVVGWFNNDGFNDIAVIDGYDGYLEVISPFGSSNCNSSTFVCEGINYFYTGYGPVFSAAAADLNQDGLSDIVLGEYTNPFNGAESSGAVLSVINSNSTPGNFFNVTAVNQFNALTYYMWNMAVSDVNGDGYPDVLIADPGQPSSDIDTGNVIYFQNDGTGNLALNLTESVPGVLSVAGAPFPAVGQPAPNAAVAPGWNIVYSGDTGSNAEMWVTEVELQNGNWTQGTTLDSGTQVYTTEGGSYPNFIVTGDLNGDGYLDFAATGFISDDSAPNGLLNVLVPFYYGNDSQVALNNSSELPTPGNYSLGMSYPGNQLFQPNSTATTPITVLKGTIGGSNVSGPGTVNYGAAFTLSASIAGVANGALPAGKVTFFDGGTQIGSPVNLTAGEGISFASLNVTQNLTAGAHTIYISYSGDADYLVAPDTASTPLQVNGETFTLNLTTSATSGTATSGSMVNIQVSGQTATGAPIVFPTGETVSLSGLPFLNNPILTFNSSGVASFNYGALAPGSYTVWANYGGDSIYAAAQTAFVNFNVNPTPVTVSLSSSANPITYPATASLTASATSGGLGVPFGSLQFEDAGVLMSTSSLAAVNGNSGLLASGTNNPYAVLSGDTVIASVTGDFNHDGNPDIATVQINADSSATLVVALGNGDGTFQAPIVYGTTTGATAADTSSNSIAVADLTGSGYADSLVIGASDGTITVYLYNGNANGILALSQTLSSGFSSVVGVATAKLNTTGQVGFAAITTNAVEAWVDNGNGTFPTSPYWTTSSPNPSSSFTGIVFTDLNNDGYVDVAISDNNGANGPDLLVLIYDPGVSSYAAPVTYAVGVSATGIASGNLNNDVYPDLAVLSNIDSTVDVLLNNQSGGFPTGTIYGVATNPTGIAIADFNGDGFADIAVSGNGTGAGSGTSVLLSSSTGLMTGETLLSTTSAGSVAAGDFNIDGNTDLAVGSTGVTIFLDTSSQAIDANQTFTAGTQPLTGVYVPLEGSYFAGSTSSTLDLTVNQEVPAFTWNTPAAISYGTALSATQLDATPPAGIPGTLSYTPDLGTVLTAGTHQLAATFVPNDAVDYESVTQFVNITVNPLASTITWSNPAAITYGTALSATQLDATASVPGAFTYDPAAPTVLTAGTHQLSVTFTPTDSVDYTSSTKIVSITVGQATPTVTWANPAGITYGTTLSAAQLDASASVPGVLTYNPAAGTLLTAGTHTLSVTFSPTDGIDYAAVTKTASIVIGQASTTITWTAPAAITYGTSLGAAQLDASASVPGTFIYNPAAGTVLGAGTHTLGVTFTPTDNTDYAGSTSSTSIQVSQATPTVTWANPSGITYGTALGGAQLDASASVPGSFTYNPAAGTVLGAGTHTLTATFTPTDSTDYSSPTANATIVVSQAGTTVTWANPAAITYGTALGGAQLDATASVGGTFSYNPPAGTVLAAGTHTLAVTFTPTDNTDYQSSSASASITVSQGTTTVTWGAPVAINYGTPLSATQLDATASVPGTFTYNPPLGTVLTAGTHQMTANFTPADGVDYKGSSAAVSITVNQVGSSIVWGNPASITYGTALSATQLDATGSVPGVITYNPPLGTVLAAGTHSLTANFVPTDSVDYKSSSDTVSITVSQATPTVTWGAPASITYGTALTATQLDATASVPGTFTYNPALGTVLTAGSHQLSVTFAPKDGTDYITQTANTTIQVSQGTSTITWAAPTAITYGTALSAAQLDATASVPGTFTYNPAIGTILTAGAHTLGVTFTPTDTTDYQSATSSVSIQVNQAVPAITWATPAAIAYGTALSTTQLDATASTAGLFTYTPAAGTQLTAGSHTLSVSFAPTDTIDYSTGTGSVTIQVTQATPVITWPSPGTMSYGTPLGGTQLDATATPSGGTFTYNPPAGTTLPVGTQTLGVSYVPTDTTDYLTATATTTVNVVATLGLTSISPTSAPYNSGATTITLIGLGFAENSIVQLNGTAISSAYVSPTQLTAQIPASFFQQTSAGSITVFDPVHNLTTAAATFTVTLPNPNISFSGPSTAPPDEQPTLNLTLSQAYPIDIQGTMTLTVSPLTQGGPTDPAVQFSTGGVTYNFTIPAGSTTTPDIQIQTGTLGATITVDLSLQINDVEITPAPSPVVILVPTAAPVITSASLARNGNTLTVTIVGYSSTRDMSTAAFDFTAAAGSSISNPEINVDVSSEFTTWYANSSSVAFGSEFSYQQVFNLNNEATTIGSVTVELTNSKGESNQVTAQ
jgi:hypothetical protein